MINDRLLQSRTEDLPVWLLVTEYLLLPRQCDSRQPYGACPCNVFVVLRRVRNSRTIIIIIIIIMDNAMDLWRK